MLHKISEVLQQGEVDNIQEDNSVPESGTWSFISESVMPAELDTQWVVSRYVLSTKAIIGLRQKTKQMDTSHKIQFNREKVLYVL